MPYPLLILTESGTKIGFGHLNRCLSLAHAFRNAGIETEIWAATHDTQPNALAPEIRSVDWYGLSGDLAQNAAHYRAILVDSYVATLSDVEKVYSIHPRVAVIDDYLRREYTRGIVIDWTVGAEAFAFQRKRIDHAPAQAHHGIDYHHGRRFPA